MNRQRQSGKDCGKKPALGRGHFGDGGAGKAFPETGTTQRAGRKNEVKVTIHALQIILQGASLGQIFFSVVIWFWALVPMVLLVNVGWTTMKTWLWLVSATLKVKPSYRKLLRPLWLLSRLFRSSGAFKRNIKFDEIECVRIRRRQYG